MQVTHFDRLQKLKVMTLRCKGALGDDFTTVVGILDRHIRTNKMPSLSQMRLRGQIDAICGM